MSYVGVVYAIVVFLANCLLALISINHKRRKHAYKKCTRNV